VLVLKRGLEREKKRVGSRDRGEGMRGEDFESSTVVEGVRNGMGYTHVYPYG
jgi:hypothetical protein